MDLMHVNSARPYWYELSIIGIVVYVLLAPAIAARVADLRIVAAVPVIGQTAASAYAVLQQLRGIEAIGPESWGVRATAAGLSEAMFPWSVGAAASSVCSVLIAAGLANAREARTPMGSVTLALGGLAAVATGAVMLYLSPIGPGIPPGPTIAAAPLMLSVIGLAAAIATLIWPWDQQLLREARVGWLWTFAASAAVAAALMLWASNRLTAIAAGR